jgi:phosphatidylserine decarboxylase
MTDQDSPAADRGSLGERLYVALQYALPQHPLSRALYALTRLPAGPLTQLAIAGFVRAFDVDLRDAVEADIRGYATFNAFFTRALHAAARPPDPRPQALLSPVDGRISQIGRLDGKRLIQAKGHGFDVTALLGGDAARAAPYTDGTYVTLYLAPRDYHRVHMPLSATLTAALHVPGRLFSVNAITAAHVPRLYARNERLVCLFDTAVGPLAVVLVGAIFVGGIETIWHGLVTPPRGRKPSALPLPAPAPQLARGAELGRFAMGSTVIVLLPQGAARWLGELGPGTPVKVGQALGLLADPAGG